MIILTSNDLTHGTAHDLKKLLNRWLSLSRDVIGSWLTNKENQGTFSPVLMHLFKSGARSISHVSSRRGDFI